MSACTKSSFRAASGHAVPEETRLATTCIMIRHIIALAIFLLVCLLIGLGARSGRAHVLDLAWVGLLWTFIFTAGVSVLFKARNRWREPGALASIAGRGLWQLPLPRGVLRWLFDERAPSRQGRPPG
jgi:hypothetical protein